MLKKHLRMSVSNIENRVIILESRGSKREKNIYNVGSSSAHQEPHYLSNILSLNSLVFSKRRTVIPHTED